MFRSETTHITPLAIDYDSVFARIREFAVKRASVLIFMSTADFLGYLKSYVREENGVVILRMAGVLSVLIFFLEWVVLTLAFKLRYHAFLEGNNGAGGGGLRVQDENQKNWPWVFQA
ncbi:hypothetical protein JRO89_XS03G0041600 [Xanthoceras sorbifolium]|uniref:Uncharacterized protein n=1 Tax=Xanthoceras sorbifolium TaxID=99658 RepID=A0ABQ8I945_9ROSI|nr:hypothetical protein JRO89_XS03G0041600 [Xanthoceras sorbifolium]